MCWIWHWYQQTPWRRRCWLWRASKKEKITKHVSAGIDNTVEEEEDVNSSLFDVEFEDDQENLEEDNEIPAESNSVNSSQSELLEPCEYENIRNNNIAELNAKLAEAQEAGLF